MKSEKLQIKFFAKPNAAFDLEAVVPVFHRFIREHACEGIGVDDVLSQVPVSRSVLQRRFRSLLGRSIHAVTRTCTRLPIAG